jgi:hypothetical protein
MTEHKKPDKRIEPIFKCDLRMSHGFERNRKRVNLPQRGIANATMPELDYGNASSLSHRR